MKNTTALTTYKGFRNDLKCREMQYTIGESYEHTGPVKACEGGFHACEYPLDVFNFYEPSDSRFAIVEQSGQIDKETSDSKVASSHIHIKAELSLGQLIQAAVEFTMSRVDKSKGENNKKEKGHANNTGGGGAANNTGIRGAANNTGDYGAANNTGIRGAANNTGIRGAANNTGGGGAANNTGIRGAANNTGDYGAANNTGDYGAANNTGGGGVAFTVGWDSTAKTDGEKSLAVAVGVRSQAKASKGSWIVLAHHDGNYDITLVKTAQAGVTKGVKADTYYQLDAAGKFVEIK